MASFQGKEQNGGNFLIYIENKYTIADIIPSKVDNHFNTLFCYMNTDALKSIFLYQTDLNHVLIKEWIGNLDDLINVDSPSEIFKPQTSTFS